jgi:hypothetical protein
MRQIGCRFLTPESHAPGPFRPFDPGRRRSAMIEKALDSGRTSAKQQLTLRVFPRGHGA